MVSRPWTTLYYSLQSDPTNERVQIGKTYLFEGVGGPDGTVGTVTSATVNENDKVAYIAVTTAQGGLTIVTRKMTDDAVADYKAHGYAYFGDLGRPKQRHLSSTSERFEWLMECYAETPRARLLELAKGAPNFDELQKMSDEDLRANYCEMLTGRIEQQSQKSGLGRSKF